MGQYILKKIIYGFLILFGVVTLVFFLQSSIGGNPALLLGGQNATPEIIANIEKDLGLDLPLYERYGLYLNDLSPVSFHNSEPESHIYYDTSKYSGIALFDIGQKTLIIKYPYLRRSYIKGDVADIILNKLPATLVLAFFAVLIAFIFGVLFGILSARKKGSFIDNTSFMFAITGMSAPSFFTAAIMSNVFGVLWAEESNLPIFPLVAFLFGLFIGIINFFLKRNKKEVTLRKKFSFSKALIWGGQGFVIGLVLWTFYIIGYSIFGFENIPLIGETILGPGTGLDPTGSLIGTDDYTGEDFYNWNSIVLPAITLGVRPLAIVMQLMRSSMLDVMNEDYIRTARAKGLSEFTVTTKHALKNAMNPVVTAISGSFASLLAGSVFVEKVFDWKGIGFELLEAIRSNDLPLVLGITIVISAFFVLINLIVDILYGFLDPRIRLK